MRSLAYLSMLSGALLLSSGVAEAQVSADANRATLFFSGGFGGELESASRGDYSVDFADVDLKPTVGLGGSIDFALIQYLSIGALTRLHFWGVDQDELWIDQDKRYPQVDLSGLLRLRFPIASAEIYLAVPAGLSLGWTEDINVSGLGTIDFATGVGWNAGVMVGAQYILTDTIGFFAEFGGTWRSIRHAWDGPFGADGSLRYSASQLSLHAGLAFLL